MSGKEYELLSSWGIVSVFVAPIFLHEQFWGFIKYDDCFKERVSPETEQSILMSASRLIANALLKTEMMLSIRSESLQLEVALEKAYEKNMIKTNFMSSMSHEMRTPLNAIIGLSELSLDNGMLDEETRSYIEKIYNAGDTLLSTVNNILDVSKIEAKKLELVPSEYDIPKLINDAVTQNIVRIGDKPIIFIMDINNLMPLRLFGDELRVKYIFNNLLSNAFKYTMEGSVELGVRCTRNDDTVWLEAWVKDTGRGIRPEDMGKLFSDYAQLDVKLNPSIEGTGLGLSITKKLVELMDGVISVESEYGKGSVFTMKIKQGFVTDETISEEQVNNLKSLRYSDNKRKRNTRRVRVHLPYARVLVADDNPSNLDVIKGMMKPYGMQIDCVVSGQQAVDAIREEKVRYNAIFMDHMMPGMDGIEATRIIRNNIGTEYARNIPIIAFTANAIVGNEEMFLNNGFQAFVSKPIELDVLDSVILEWVRDKELEKKNADDNIEQPENTTAPLFHWHIESVDLQKAYERFDNSEEILLKILASYSVNTRALLETIEKCNRENLEEYAICVHGIKGSSFGISANAVGEKAKALEKAAKAGDFEFVSANNADFVQAIKKLVEELDGLLRQVALENPKPKKDKIDNDSLAKLIAACENCDIQEVEAVMEEIEAFDYESDGELAAWVRENAYRMNFKQMAETLAKNTAEMNSLI
jgi:signal transduction histidine kinase/CheY-like chemotaxis protein